MNCCFAVADDLQGLESEAHGMSVQRDALQVRVRFMFLHLSCV